MLKHITSCFSFLLNNQFTSLLKSPWWSYGFFSIFCLLKVKKSDIFASAEWHSARNCSQQQVRILYEFMCPFSWWVFGFVTVLQEPLKSRPACVFDCITALFRLKKNIQGCIFFFCFYSSFIAGSLTNAVRWNTHDLEYIYLLWCIQDTVLSIVF